MQGWPGSWGASNIFLCRIPHSNIQASAQNLTIIYMMFPPLTLPKKEATTIKGKSRNISRRKTTNAYILYRICIRRRKSFINKHEYIISAGRIFKNAGDPQLRFGLLPLIYNYLICLRMPVLYPKPQKSS